MIRRETKQNKLRVLPFRACSAFFSAFFRVLPFRACSAFTLVELIIAIGILAILASVSFINIVNYRQRQALDLTVQEIVTVLRNAQDRSLSQEGGTRWGVHFVNAASPASDYYELFSGTNYSSSTIVSKTVLRSNIQFDIPSSNTSSTVIFSPISGMPDVSITIKISLINTPTVSSTIVINSNGEIQY